jgi:hypothetical protein
MAVHPKNSAALDYSLLHMISELDKSEEVMRHCSQLLETFDTMADGHLLVHKAAFDEVGAAADGSLMSSVVSAGQASALSSAAKSRKAPGHRTGSASPISAVPSVLGAVQSAPGGNRTPVRRQKSPLPSRGDFLASWMQDNGIEVRKAFHASNLECTLNGTDVNATRRPILDPTIGVPGDESEIGDERPKQIPVGGELQVPDMVSIR